jgi:hypothetical protein
MGLQKLLETRSPTSGAQFTALLCAAGLRLSSRLESEHAVSSRKCFRLADFCLSLCCCSDRAGVHIGNVHHSNSGRAWFVSRLEHRLSIFRGFPEHLHGNTELVPQLGHNCVLPNPLESAIHHSCCHTPTEGPKTCTHTVPAPFYDVGPRQ